MEKKQVFVLLSVVVAITLAIVAYCLLYGNQYTVKFDSKGGTEIEKQTVRVGNKVEEPEIPVREGYRFIEWQLDGEKYGRIISSSDSLEDAVRVCTRHFTDNRYPQAINTVVECNVIYESDILYGINVKWELTNNGKFDGRYEENVVSFKKNVADITVRNVIYDDVESYSICTNQEEQIKQIALYLYYNKNSIHHILNYETSYNDNEFIITIYAYHVIGGDWDLPSTYSFYKQTVVVDKTGDVNFQEPIVLKTVYK